MEARLLSNELFYIRAHWQPPIQPNGILSDYNLCLSGVELVGSQLSSSTNSTCL